MCWLPEQIIKAISISVRGLDDVMYSAKIIYFRDITEDHKKKQTVSVIENDRDKPDRLLGGILQNEYPNDFLDDSILDAVKQEFPEASIKIKSGRLLSILQLTYLRNLLRVHSIMHIVPNCVNITADELAINCISFGVDLFVDKPSDQAFFSNRSFTISLQSDDWLNTSDRYNRARSTFHKPSEFFV